MPDYRVPGTYVREVERLRTIDPAASVTAFVGACAQGPVGTPVTVTSPADYHATFGPSLDASRPLGHAVELFFAGGGRSAVVVRAAGATPEDLVPEDGDPHAAVLDGTGVGVLVVAGLSVGHTVAVTRALRRCTAYSAVLLLDPPAGPWRSGTARDLAALTEHRERAAVFHPWVEVGGTALPASGAVAGVIARTDEQRGVWRAPAGTEAGLRGVDGLLSELTDDDINELTGLGVNPIRDLPGYGPVVWGARVLGSVQSREPSERYLSVRRLVDHVHRSLRQGLGWAVVEPAAPETWGQVRSATTHFLHGLWRAGALVGSKESEAYFVRVGLGETMTEADLAAGRLVVTVGLATTRPAEFEVLQVTLLRDSPVDTAGLVLTRADGREDGEEWAENFERLPGGAGVSLILESTTQEGVGPRLHRHPYPETFVIRRGSALFTIAGQQVPGRAGQVLVVPAHTPHTFTTGPDGYEAVHIHAADAFETEWLE